MTAEEFRSIRVTRGFTQAALAEFLGYSSHTGRMHITQIEAGRKEITRPVELVMLALRDGWKYRRT